MTPAVRKFALTTHVTASVGWAGAVAAFLGLALLGVLSVDAELVRASYIVLHPITWFVIVPFSIAASLTGIVQSLGTPWGLFRHYWLTVKVLLTGVASVVLLVHTQPIDQVAALAIQRLMTPDDLWRLRLQLVGDASAALFVLFATTMLSVYRPWGLTPYGLRMQETASPILRTRITRPPNVSGRYLLIGFAIVIGVIIALHIAGFGLHLH